MNINILLTVVLLVVLRTPIINLTNKTVQFFKNILLHQEIYKMLCEVTHVMPRESFSSIPHVGVANGIVSPNSLPCLSDGWKHIGDKITFIICDKDAPVCFWLTKKKIMIWQNDGLWFFCDSKNKTIIRLKQKNSQLAESVVRTARIFGKMALRHYIQSKISPVEIETV